MSNIRLSAMQSEAVDSIVSWYKKPVRENQLFYLAGYAGSGKTTLVSFVLDALGISDSEVCFATYTGKAAMVLSQKTDKDVSTIHSLCYELVDENLDEKSNRVNMVWKLRSQSPLRNAKLLVLDEVSMVNKDMMKDLLHFKCKVLVLGDPFQLPPVDGDAYFHEEYEPDFFLTEIHRQALENPIIWLSQQVRNRKNIAFGKYGDSVVKMHSADAATELWTEADQVIVGTNKTRRHINGWFREVMGFESKNSRFPVIGDRLICLRNRWDDGLVNGMIMTAASDAKVAKDRESFVLSFTVQDGNETVKFTDMNCSSAEVLGGIKLNMPFQQQKKLVSVDYGYAITCHKAQGSQYNDVLFLDEGFGRWTQDNTYYRHLYTAITRAAENLIILE